MPYAETNGVRLFYTDEGNGPLALMLVHGLSGDSHDWNWVIPILQPKYRIVAFDLRGHGHSSVPDRYEMRDFVGDIVGLLDVVECDSVVIAGHSLGGAIAAVTAVEHPERVRALIEVDPAYALPDWLVGFWEEGRAHWRASLDSGERLLSLQPARFALPATPDFLTTWNDRRAQAMPVDVHWKAYEGLADAPQQLFVSGPAADDYLHRRQCPILSFHSLRGRAAWEEPLFQHSGSRAVEWEGSGHSLHVERPRELAYLAMAWLDYLTGAVPAPPTVPTTAAVAAHDVGG